MGRGEMQSVASTGDGYNDVRMPYRIIGGNIPPWLKDESSSKQPSLKLIFSRGTRDLTRFARHYISAYNFNQ